MTLAEITAAIAADPTLKTGLYAQVQPEVLAAAKGTGMIIRTKEEDTAYMTNYENTVLPGKIEAAVSTQIGGKLKENWDAFDAKVLAASGIKKNPNEKSIDYLERAVGEVKTAGADGDQKQLLTQLQAQVAERKDWVAPEKLTELTTSHFKEKQSLRIAAAQEKFPIAVPAHITDDAAKQQFIDNQRRLIALDMTGKYEAKVDKDGNITYYDGTTVMMDTKSGKPMDEAQIMETQYSGYFAPIKKGAPGGGSGPAGGGGTGDRDIAEAELKDKDAVNTYLTDVKKLKIGDPKRTAEYKRILTDNGIAAE